MEKIQTAVEWLFEELNKIRLEDESENLTILDFFELQNHAYNKAKAMEKDQIMLAYMSGEVGKIFELKNTLTAKQYYDNNYGK